MNIPCFLQPNKSTHLQKHNKNQTKHTQQQLTTQIKTRNHLQPIQASHTNHRNNNGNKHDHQNEKRGNGRAKKCQRGQARVRRRRGGRRRWRDDRRRRRAGKQGGGREGKVKLFCFFYYFIIVWVPRGCLIVAVGCFLAWKYIGFSLGCGTLLSYWWISNDSKILFKSEVGADDLILSKF